MGEEEIIIIKNQKFGVYFNYFMPKKTNILENEKEKLTFDKL